MSTEEVIRYLEEQHPGFEVGCGVVLKPQNHGATYVQYKQRLPGGTRGVHYEVEDDGQGCLAVELHVENDVPADIVAEVKKRIRSVRNNSKIIFYEKGCCLRCRASCKISPERISMDRCIEELSSRMNDLYAAFETELVEIENIAREETRIDS